MALIDEVIKIQITRDNVGITRTSFDTALILGSSLTTFTDVVKSYSDLDGVAQDFETTDTEYVMASKFFGQTTRPDHVLISQQLDADTMLDAYNIAKEINPDFYGVMTTSQEDADVLAIAAQVETESRIYGVSAEDNEIISGDTDNLLEQLHELNYDRTFLFYHTTASVQRPEAALFGKMLSITPGSASWAFKQLNGVSGDKLTSTDRTNLRLNKGIFYSPLAGRNATLEGNMVSGEFIDVIFALDWLEQYLKENMAALFLSVPKIPYNNDGLALVENVIRASMQEAVNRGIFNPDYTVTMPKLADISLADKANRFFPGTKITATLAGAIHSLSIDVTASV